MDYLPQFPDNYFELALVDPPYGIGNFLMETSGAKRKKIGKGVKINRNYKGVEWNDNRPNEKYFNELKRVSKNRIIWGANYYNCFDDTGGAIIWYKRTTHPNLSKCEIASCSIHKKVEYIDIQWNGFIGRNCVTIHPCQKPVELYRWLLKNYAKPNDKILDTHVGSASSLIACIDMGFEYIGFEKDKDYYDAACKRIKNHTDQIRMI